MYTVLRNSMLTLYYTLHYVDERHKHKPTQCMNNMGQICVHTLYVDDNVLHVPELHVCIHSNGHDVRIYSSFYQYVQCSYNTMPVI